MKKAPKSYACNTPCWVHQVFAKAWICIFSAMMDKRGEGVQIILDRSERLSGSRPVYRMVDDSELVLVIPAAAPVAKP